MNWTTPSQDVNTNMNAFEDLASSLASLFAYQQQDATLRACTNDFCQLYKDATEDSPTYASVNDYAGHALRAADRQAGRAAWLLTNTECLGVLGVHSLLRHSVGKRLSSPVLAQVADSTGTAAVPVDFRKTHPEISGLFVDVLGVHRGEVWVVQTLTGGATLDSALRPKNPDKALFPAPPRVFDNPRFGGKSLQTLDAARFLLEEAFPSLAVRTFCLVTPPHGPDFELYQVVLGRNCPSEIVLSGDAIRSSSLQPQFRDKLAYDPDSLHVLPERLEDDLFKGLPPCRGGRTLSMLALLAKEQRVSNDLLLWDERVFRDRLRTELGYHIPRDKVRHDLVDRLSAQGRVRKWGSEYHLTVKGMSSYLYSLTKYTSKAPVDPMDAFEECLAHRAKISARCKCP